MSADKELNFWVRDGTRCDLFSIVTRYEGLVPSKLNNTFNILRLIFSFLSYDKILDLLVSVNYKYHYSSISDLSTS